MGNVVEYDFLPLRAHGDMASCSNDTCASHEVCWRWKKPDNNFRQSYVAFTPGRGADRCDSFIGIKEKAA